jgi:hypothetical protein
MHSVDLPGGWVAHFNSDLSGDIELVHVTPSTDPGDDTVSTRSFRVPALVLLDLADVLRHRHDLSVLRIIDKDRQVVSPPAEYHQGIIIRSADREGPRLPPGCKLLGVSPHIYFMKNLVAYKVEHEGIRPTRMAGELPRVEPRWEGDSFSGWDYPGYDGPVYPPK